MEYSHRLLGRFIGLAFLRTFAHVLVNCDFRVLTLSFSPSSHPLLHPARTASVPHDRLSLGTRRAHRGTRRSRLVHGPIRTFRGTHRPSERRTPRIAVPPRRTPGSRFSRLSRLRTHCLGRIARLGGYRRRKGDRWDFGSEGEFGGARQSGCQEVEGRRHGAHGARLSHRHLGFVLNSPTLVTLVSVRPSDLIATQTGAFVAGLDAGLMYNTFPLMGDRLVPPTQELVDRRYARSPDGSDLWWRSVFENPTTVQFDHRVLALSTLTATAGVFLYARNLVRRGGGKSSAAATTAGVPPATLKLVKGAFHMAILQAGLGISTLLYLVPTPLASAHQAGSLVLLTLCVAAGASLRRPGAAARRWLRQTGLTKTATRP
jgi:heme A synthase